MKMIDEACNLADILDKKLKGVVVVQKEKERVDVEVEEMVVEAVEDDDTVDYNEPAPNNNNIKNNNNNNNGKKRVFKKIGGSVLGGVLGAKSPADEIKAVLDMNTVAVPSPKPVIKAKPKAKPKAKAKAAPKAKPKAKTNTIPSEPTPTQPTAPQKVDVVAQMADQVFKKTMTVNNTNNNNNNMLPPPNLSTSITQPFPMSDDDESFEVARSVAQNGGGRRQSLGRRYSKVASDMDTSNGGESTDGSTTSGGGKRKRKKDRGNLFAGFQAPKLKKGRR